MRIKEINIQRCGPLAQLVLAEQEMNGPVQVFYGANETGKSSLHYFLRRLIFAPYQKQRKKRPYTIKHLESDLEGQLTLQFNDQEELQISCTTQNGRPQYTYTNQRGEALTAKGMKQRTGTLNEAFYRHIYAFGLDELQRIETLQGEEVSDYLYSAAMGTGGQSLLEIEKQCEKVKQKWFKPRATNPIINRKLVELEQLQHRIKEIKEQEGQYRALQKKYTQLQKEREELKQKQQQDNEQRIAYQYALQITQIKADIEHIQHQLYALPDVDQDLIALEIHIQQLTRDQSMMLEYEQEIQRLEVEREQISQEVEQNLARLGQNWTAQDVRRLDVSIPLQDQLIRMAQEKESLDDNIDALREKGEEKERERDRQEQKCNQLKSQIEAIKSEQVEERRKSSVSSLSALQIVMIGMGFILPGWYGMQGDIITAVVLFGALAGSFSYYWYVQRSARRLRQEQRQLQQRSASERIRDREEELQRECLILDEMKREQQNLINAQEKVKLKREQLLQAYRELISAYHLHESTRSDALILFFQLMTATHKELAKMDRITQKHEQLVARYKQWKRKVLSLAAPFTAVRDVHVHTLLDTLWLRLKEEKEKQEKIDTLNIKRRQLEQQMKAKQKEAEQMGWLKEQTWWQETLSRTEPQMKEKLYLHKKEEEQRLQAIEEISTQIGNVSAELAKLEGNDMYSVTVHQFEEKKDELNALVKEWSVQVVAQAACQHVRRMYEEEKQPVVMKEASGFFELMTEGRYKKVIAPFDQPELYVIGEDGKRFESTSLSKGAKEQLYLALRLAMIKANPSTEPFPILMDDIFVNFDRKRLSQALKGLKTVARTHQVLIFTCHEHIITAIQENLREVNVCPLASKSVHTAHS